MAEGASSRASLAAGWDFADLVIARTRTVLGDGFVGGYVVGSLATGDAHPPFSDVDLMVICDGPLGPLRGELAAAVLGLGPACPWAGLEYVVYDRAVVAELRYPVRYEVNINVGGTRPVHVSTAGDPPHWFLLELAMARDHAVARPGPPLATLVGAPAHADVLAALRTSLDWHREHESTSPNTVLNACRSWHFAETSQWVSKTDAGQWAVQHHAETGVVAQALRLRDTPSVPPLDTGDVAAFLDAVVQRVAASPA